MQSDHSVAKWLASIASALVFGWACWVSNSLVELKTSTAVIRNTLEARSSYKWNYQGANGKKSYSED